MRSFLALFEVREERDTSPIDSVSALVLGRLSIVVHGKADLQRRISICLVFLLRSLVISKHKSMTFEGSFLAE